ncbi:MAG: very short patch repair endonuclease [Sphingosinicella sp.]|uniref:very short patch repair endonuclease n=1 Tax=Sphingosinicella sp. TaxID=1917971 RepID=UPI004037CBDD
MDTRSREQRSRIMASVGTKDTGPELAVRKLLHRLGYRYRLHRKDLPGRPDIVFPGRRLALFVHGCFWHGHDCPKGRLPKSRPEYWAPKIARNLERDAENRRDLGALGWRSATLWQCELKDRESLEDKLRELLGPPGRPS